MPSLLSLCLVLAAACMSSAQSGDYELVFEHVLTNASLSFRNASGVMPYPYQVPSGAYMQLWDW